MAITPAEIRHTPLRRGLFGYKRPDVDDMLDEVVDAYQELWQERVDLRDQIERLRPGSSVSIRKIKAQTPQGARIENISNVVLDVQ